MDKNFIKQNNLNEAVKRFQEIAGYKSPKQSLKEWSFFNMIDEEGEDNGNDLQQPNGGGMQQGDMQQQPQNNQAQDTQNMGGDMNGQMGGEMQPQGTEMPQNGDMGMQNNMQQPPMDGGMGEMPMGDEQPQMDGEMPMGDEQQEDGIETQEMEPDDEVIDVDDLTQSQEATEYKIDGVDDRLSKIFAVVKDFSDKLDKQEQSIMNLKDEFEKRNPTQTEKFNIRSQAGGPFNQSVSDYWDNFSQSNPNYEIMRDNDVSPSDEQEQFNITKNDISGLNMKNISDTLDINQDLKDYIGF